MANTILLFSALAETLGRRELVVDHPSPIRAGDLLDLLAQDFEAIASMRRSIRLAVNCEYVDEDFSVSNGDEVALITPTSGG